ncbi:unnamed protein product [Lampetra planeri]
MLLRQLLRAPANFPDAGRWICVRPSRNDTGNIVARECPAKVTEARARMPSRAHDTLDPLRSEPLRSLAAFALDSRQPPMPPCPPPPPPLSNGGQVLAGQLKGG